MPANQIAKIKYEVLEDNIAEKAKKEVSDFQKFILAGPIMNDEQYTNFSHRKHFERIDNLKMRIISTL